ncbi:phage tail tape measure protein [Niallia sp. 01092]|uniref:phage tail tape measure protein n=1 Tax=Niallia sp. 01092 TaxID=3457759 RepID=UPI003FD1B5DB
MAQPNGLTVTIQGKLKEKETEQTIKSQLAKIEKKLNIGVGINGKELQNITKQIESIQKKIANTKVSPVSSKDISSVKELYSSVEKAVEKYKQFGQVKVNQTLNPLNQQVEKFNLAVTDATGKVSKLYFENAKLNSSMQGLSGFALTGKTTSDNSQKIREQQLQTEQKINSQIEQQNNKIAKQIELFQKEMQINARNLSARNTNNSNFDTAGLNSWLNSVQKISSSTPNATHEMDRLRLQYRDISSEARNSAINTNGFGDSLARTVGTMARFTIVSAAMFAPFTAMDKLIENMYKLDELLISIQKVMPNGTDMAEVFNTASDAAFSFGQTIDGALSSLGNISRLGFKEVEATAVNAKSLLLSTIGEMTPDEAANGLVSQYRQWGLAIEDLDKVVDSLNNVSNNTCSTVKGLLDALSKSSGVAKNAGLSFDQLVGQASMLSETLKLSGNEVGNFQKTLYNRYMRDSSQNFIESLGVQTKEANGEMRNAFDVLLDLSKVSKTLDSQTLNQLAQVLGGGWMNSKVLTMLDNMDRAVENTNTSMNSYGSGTQELATYQEGLAYQTNNLIASMQELGWTISENGVRSGLVLLLKGTTDLIKGFNEFTSATHGLNIYLPLAGAAIYGVVKAVRALRIGLTALKSSFGIFSIGIVAVEMLASVFMKSTNAAGLHTEALSEAAESASKNSSELEYLIGRYKDLESQSDGSAQKQQELQGVLEGIQKINPALIESTGKYGDKLKLNKGNAEEYLESLKAMTKEQVAMAKAANEAESSLLNIDIEKENDKLADMKDDQKRMLDDMLAYKDKYNVEAKKDAEEDYNNRIAELAKKQEAALQANDEDGYRKYKGQFIEAQEEFRKYMEAISNSDDLQKYADQLQKVQELEGKKNSLEERQKALDGLTDSTKKNSNASAENENTLDQLAKKTGDLEEGAYDGAGGMQTLSDKIKDAKGDFEALSKIVLDLAKAGDFENSIAVTQKDLYESTAETIAPLNGLLEDLAEGKQITANEAIKLANSVEGLSDSLSIENGQVKVNEKGVVALRDAHIKSFNGIIEAQKKSVLSSKETVAKKLEYFRTEIMGIQSVADAEKKRAEISAQMAEAFGNGNGELGAELAKQFTAINSLVEPLDKLNDLQKTLDFTSKGLSEIGTEAESVDKATDKSTYVTDKYKQAQEKLNLELAKIQSKKKDLVGYSKKYQDSIKAEIKLTEKQLKLNKEQTRDLESQIKSGNIKQTGKVTKSDSASSESVVTGGISSPYSGSLVNKNLKQQTRVSASELNKWINSRAGKGSVMYNSGQAFIDAANASGLDPLYLVAHAAHETGWGNSNIAKSKNNFYGIGAFDASPYASSYGYNGANAGIIEGAKWISDNYANGRYGQDTLQKMRFNNGTHQYATDPGWANKIAAIMSGSGLTGNTTGYSSDKAVTASTGVSSDKSSEKADRAQAIDNAKSNVNILKEEAVQLQDQIKQLNMDLINSIVAGFDHAKESYSDNLAQIDLVQNKENETSKEWIKQQQKKESLVGKQLEQESKSIKYLKQQVKSNKELTEAQKDQLNDNVQERMKEMISLEQQLLDERLNMADKVIDAYKQSAEAVKDAQLKVIDDVIEGINKEADEADYKKNLEKAQKDRQDLLDEIAKLQLDDSYEARSKVSDLQKQLADQDENIDDMQSDKFKEKRIENLNNRKDAIEEKYNNLVNNEQKFADMRSNIINGNMEQITKDLDGYYANIKANTTVLGKAMSNNILDLIIQANRYMNGKDFKPIKIASFATGGETNWAGNEGKISILHPNEKILNKDETKEFKDSLTTSQKLASTLGNLDVSKLININVNVPQAPASASAVTNNSSTSYSPVIHLRIGNIYGTDRDAVVKLIKAHADDTLKRVYNRFKSTGGK